MSLLLKEKIYDYIFLFISATIVPISVLAPIGIWIPLSLSALIIFSLEKKKSDFLKINNKIDLIIFLIFLYITFSLIWSINFEHGINHIIHIIIVFFSTKVLLISSNKIKEFNKIKFTLYYSLVFTALITIIDIYFNLGIKAFLLYLSELVNTADNFSGITIKNINLNKTKFTEGMYSGLYNRGIAVITILFFILSITFHTKKIYFYPLFLISILLSLVGESFTIKTLIILALIIYLSTKVLKNKVYFLFPLTLIVYFFVSPILFNVTDQEEWNNDFLKHTNNLLILEKITLANTFSGILGGNLNNLDLFFSKTKSNLYLKIHHRKMIWSFTSREIKKKFFFGHGFSSSRKLGEENLIISKSTKDDDIKTRLYPAIPLHPHNNTLQVWLELGLIGCILFLLLHLFLWNKLYERTESFSTAKLFLIITFVGVFYINQISFGLWQTWWLSAIGYFIIFSNLFLNANLSRSLK